MRGAIFVDYAFYRRITLLQIKDGKWLINNIKLWCKKNPGVLGTINRVTEWEVYIFDARYDGNHAKFLKPGLIHEFQEDYHRMEKVGMHVRLGEYAIRYKVNDRMAKYGEFGEPYFMQKGVDTLIAIETMDELQKGAAVFCYITNDRDFIPLFNRIKDEHKVSCVFYSSTAGESPGILSAVTFATDVNKEGWLQGSTRKLT